MIIAIDIDDTITHAPVFFRALTNALHDAEVIVVSYRDDLEDAVETLRDHGIRYDRIILSNDPHLGCAAGLALDEWKADLVAKLQADVFFEDMPEVIRHVRPPTTVFMTCDEVMTEWIRESLKRPRA